jgi:hypothetical protein
VIGAGIFWWDDEAGHGGVSVRMEDGLGRYNLWVRLYLSHLATRSYSTDEDKAQVKIEMLKLSLSGYPMLRSLQSFRIYPTNADAMHLS